MAPAAFLPLLGLITLQTGQHLPTQVPDTIPPAARLEFLDLFALELLNECARLMDEPLDLNRATALDLGRIPMLTPSEITDILRFREERGRLKDVAELRAIGERVYARVAPFAVVTDRSGPPVHIRLRASRAYRDSLDPRVGSLSGSPWTVYARATVGELSGDHLTVLAKKDASEPFRYAFLTASCALRRVLFFESIILGDFSVELGDGIIAGRPGRFGRGYDPVAASAPTGARAYHSSDEHGYLRGVCGSGSIGPLGFLAFASQHRISGTLNEDGTIASLFSESVFSSTGALEKRNIALETIAGGRLSLTTQGHVVLAVSYSAQRLSVPFRGSMEGFRPRQLFRTAGMDLHARVAGVSFDGVCAVSLPRGLSGRISLEYSPAGNASVSVSYRAYSPEFVSPRADAFGEHREASNEQGFYLGCAVSLAPGVRFTGFGDIFKIPLPGRARSGVQWGAEWSAMVEAKLRGWTLFVTLSGRSSEKPLSSAAWSPVRTAGRRLVRLSGGLQVDLSRGVRLFSRWDHTSSVDGASSQGSLAMEEMTVKVPPVGEISAGIILYNSGSYASRLFVTEPDVPGSCSAPSLFGSGTRWHLLCRLRQIAFLAFSVRWSGTAAHSRFGEPWGTRDGSTLVVQTDLKL